MSKYEFMVAGTHRRTGRSIAAKGSIMALTDGHARKLIEERAEARGFSEPVVIKCLAV